MGSDQHKMEGVARGVKKEKLGPVKEMKLQARQAGKRQGSKREEKGQKVRSIFHEKKENARGNRSPR